MRFCRGLVGVLHLERDGTDLSDRGVPSAAVVAVLDPGPVVSAGAGLGGPDTPVVELVFKVAKNDSAIALSAEEPTAPIERITPSWAHRVA